ncbi:MAG: alpha/beta hydrolase [Myxococcales bacterium]
MASAPEPSLAPPTRRRLGRWLKWSLPALALVLGGVWLDRRLTFAALFLRFEGGKLGTSWLSQYRARKVTTEDWRLAFGRRGRLYVPAGGATRGLLLVHGMHPQGIDEPRLTGFARSLAASGVVVGTPELPDLMRFQVSRTDVVAVADAAKQLRRELGGPGVTVFGVSFGGGLALRAACEPALSGGFGNLIALGAPADLVRVARFALGETVEGPDGKAFPLKPHAYARKAMLHFFLGSELAVPPGPGRDEVLRLALKARTPELAALSPSACRTPITVPVHLAHGLGDNVIPYTETLWLARQLPTSRPPEVLVSPAISHAEYAPPTLAQRFQLIEFMAKAADW